MRRHNRDLIGRDTELRYIRTKDGDEVDFCIIENQTPQLMIEAKFSDASLSKNLLKMHERTEIKAVQLVCHLRNEKMEGAIEIRRGYDYLSSLSA